MICRANEFASFSRSNWPEFTVGIALNLNVIAYLKDYHGMQNSRT